MSAQPKDEEGMFDSRGRWVPIRLVKAADLFRNEIVGEIVRRAQVKAEADARYEEDQLREIAAFIALQAERYGATIGGTKGNVTLLSFDGRFKVVRAMQDFIVFDERLQVAKGLVDECIREWSPGASAEIQALVSRAFHVDRAGKVSTSLVLGLRDLNIDHPKWKDAMQAISDSLRVVATKAYVRVYERVGDSDKYVPIGTNTSRGGQ